MEKGGQRKILLRKAKTWVYVEGEGMNSEDKEDWSDKREDLDDEVKFWKR